MRYEAKIRAYDMFDLVCVTATVYESPMPALERPEVVFQSAAMLHGTGEDDPRRWLAAALRGLL